MINNALGRDLRASEQPTEPISMRFTFVTDSPLATGTVVKWLPPAVSAERTVSDVALLRLADPLPADVYPVRLAAEDVPLGAPIDAFGFPEGNDNGVWARVIMAGEKADGTAQVDGDGDGGYGIRPGFSGMPAWERQFGRVAGMIVSSEREAQVRSATLVRASTIRALVGAAEPTAPYPFRALTAGLSRGVGVMERFLTEYCGTDAAPVPFVGRGEEFGRLDSWLIDPSTSEALVVAEAGRGKSALLARWSLKTAETGLARVVFVPISIRFGTADRSTALGITGERLRHAMGIVYGPPSGSDDWGAEIETLLRGDQPADLPLVIVIDGADETVGWSIERDFPLPAALGQHVKVVVSARRMAHRDAEAWASELGFGPTAMRIALKGLSRAAVAEALRASSPTVDMWSDEVVEGLYSVSEGDPLLLRLYVDALRDEGAHAPFLTLADLASMEPGLGPYLDRWWQDQLQLWRTTGVGQPEIERAEAVLALCAVAFGPIGAQEASAVAEDVLTGGLAVRRVVDDLRRLIIGDGDAHGYVFSHPRLGEHFRVRAGKRALAFWQERLLAHGRKAIAALERGEPAMTWAYAIRHHGAHLRERGGGVSDFSALVGEPWVKAWGALDATYDGFRRDLQLAWSVADEAHDVQVQLRCALLASSLVSMAGGLPPELIAALTGNGLWTRSYAVAYAMGIPRQRARVRMLVALAPFLGEDDALRALEGWRELDPGEGALLVNGLAPALSRSVLHELVEVMLEEAKALPKSKHAEVVTLVGPHARDQTEYIDRALAAMPDLREQRLQARALQRLTPFLATEQIPEALGRARAIMHLRHRAVTLAMLGARATGVMADEARREAFLAARAIIDVVERSEALADVAVAAPSIPLPSELMDELAAAAAAERLPERRARLYLALSKLPAALDRIGALDDALAAAQGVDDRVKGGGLLAQIASVLPPARRRDVLLHAIGFAREIRDDHERAEAGVALLGVMARPNPVQAARRLDELAGATVERRAKALVALAGQLDREVVIPLGDELIEAIAQLDDERRRAAVIAMLADVLGDSALERAWAMALDMASPDACKAALTAMAPRRGAAALEAVFRLTPELGSAVVASAVTADPTLAARAITVSHGFLEPEARGLALGAIAGAVGDDVDQETMAAALGTGTAIFGGRARLRVLLAIAGSTQPPICDLAAERAAAQLARVPDDATRAAGIIEVARLRPVLGPQLVGAARTLVHSATRAETLAALGAVEDARAAAGLTRTAAARTRAAVALALAGAGTWEAAFESAVEIALEVSRAEALSRIVCHAPGDVALRAFVEAAWIEGDRQRRQVLEAVASRASEWDRQALASAWTQILRVLAARPRSVFMEDVAAMAQLLVILGGVEAVEACAIALDAVAEALP